MGPRKETSAHHTGVQEEADVFHKTSGPQIGMGLKDNFLSLF